MAERKKNPFSKRREVGKPYAIYSAPGWTWKVLKTYQHPDKEPSNKYARWLVAVKSPFTYGSYEMGDSYKSDICSQATLIACTREWAVAYSVDMTNVELLD